MPIHEPMNSITSHPKLRLSLDIPDGPFIPGDTISGTFVVECRAQTGTLALGDLVVEVIGNQVLRSRDHLANNDPVHLRRVFQGGSLPPSNAVVNSIPSQSWLGNRDELPIGFFPALKGETTFAFQFELPSWAPSTVNFNTGTAEISYEVRATAGLFWRGERRYLLTKRDIIVLEAYRPTENDTKQESRIAEDGKLWVGVALQSDFIAGSSAEAMVVVRNHSLRKTTSLSLSLEHCLVVLLPTGNSTIQLSEEIMQQNFDGPEYEVGAGEEAAATLEFDIPLQGCCSSAPTVQRRNKYQPYFFIETRVRVTLGLGLTTNTTSVSVPINVWHPASVSAAERYQRRVQPANQYTPEQPSPLRPNNVGRGPATHYAAVSRPTYSASSPSVDQWSPGGLPQHSTAADFSRYPIHSPALQGAQGVYQDHIQSPYSSPGLEHANAYMPAFSPAFSPAFPHNVVSPSPRPLPTPPPPVSPLSPVPPDPVIHSPRPVVRQRRSFDGSRSISESVRKLERMVIEEDVAPTPKSVSEEEPLTPPLLGFSDDIWHPKSDDVVRSPWNWKPLPPAPTSSSLLRARAASYGDTRDALTDHARSGGGLYPPSAGLSPSGSRFRARASTTPTLPADAIERFSSLKSSYNPFKVEASPNRSPPRYDHAGLSLDRSQDFDEWDTPPRVSGLTASLQLREVRAFGLPQRIGQPLAAVSPNVDVPGAAASGSTRGGRGGIVTSLGALFESTSDGLAVSPGTKVSPRRTIPTSTSYQPPAYNLKSPSLPAELTSAFGQPVLSSSASLSRSARGGQSAPSLTEVDGRMVYGRAKLRDTMARYGYQN